MKHHPFSFAILLLTGVAQAHVVLDQPEAPAGSAYRAALRVSHGCAGSPTTAVTVQLPEGLRHVKAQPKPGWTLNIRKARLARPDESHGKPVGEGTVEISWVAQGEANQLQDDWFDEFVLRATLPERTGALWFKVLQRCVQGEQAWTEVPTEGQSGAALKAPAARLRLLPAEGGPHAGH
ncbi:MAG TPA: YcnI family protein [Roseateles sp.]|nr:YcnI family protein [Roseateles sp.]